MSEIVILNGPPGVGKSAVTAVLRTLLASTVAISGDDLRAFAPQDARAHLGGGATFRAAGALTSTFVDLGAARVIFDYTFLRAAHFRYFVDALPAGTSVDIFTLWAPLEVVLGRDRDRARGLRQQIGPDVASCYREISLNLTQMGHIVDTSAASAEDAARRVHEELANAARR